jgi:shikimate dehydrogenase
MGQLSLKTLCETYRFKTITEQTKIFALLGDPVAPSAGHVFYNRHLPANAVFVNLHMPIPDLPFFFSIMRKFPFGGFSISVPLKEQLEKFLTRIDPASAAIGSINTVKVEGEHLIGYNTDGAGALDALEERKKIKGLNVAILGAGGSARAIAYESTKRGAKVTAFNRTIERAQALATDFGCHFLPLEDFSKISYDVLINTVPVDLLFDSASLHPDAIVMDIVVREHVTPLLQAAQKRGCTWIDGQEVFEKKAKLQLKIWQNS